MPMPMKPIVTRALGLVSAAQIRDGRMNGATAAEAAACLRNERREVVMVFLSLETSCPFITSPHPEIHNPHRANAILRTGTAVGNNITPA